MSSATFQMLIEMGFDPKISCKATKIYFNDVESAVNYCSSPSVSSEETENTETSLSIYNQSEPGPYFAKCYDILDTKYPQFSSIFNQWFKEEEFEDNQLIDEFIETEEYDQSFFIQYVEDNYNKQINDKLLKRVYTDLVYVINSKKEHKLDSFNNEFESVETKVIDGYIHNIESNINPIFGVIPFQIYVQCQRYYVQQTPLKISSHSMKNIKLINEYKRLYAEQCNIICPDILLSEETYLSSLFAVGNDNNLPLLTYLVDAYNRYCIENAKILIKFELTPKQLRKYSGINCKNLLLYRINNQFQRIDESVFINKKCRFSSSKFRKICVNSMRYLMDGRRISKPSLHNTSIYRVNDSIIDYGFCIFESYSFISKYIANYANYGKMPLQFDIWIIPNSVTKDDDEMINDDIGDIESKLIYNDSKYFIYNDINCESMSDLMYESATKLLKDKMNERCCMIIDRRNNNNHKLYTYEPPIKSRKIQSNRDQFVYESFFNNSIQCILPNFGGVKEEANGYMFCLSFHCISKYQVRVYLFIDTFGTRFFIQDVTQYYLSQFFVSKQSKLLQNIMKSASKTNKFMQRYQECKVLLTDVKFEQFYKEILNDQQLSPY